VPPVVFCQGEVATRPNGETGWVSLTDDLHINRGWWPVICPLRGSLGQTQYTHIRHNGELATESALFLADVAAPQALFARYFELYGVPPDMTPSRLSDDFTDEVIEDDIVPLVDSPTMTVMDDGILVTRQGFDAHAFLLRRRPRIVQPGLAIR
jgi:hypothetical protein